MDKPAWLDTLQQPPGAVPPGTTRSAPLLFDTEHRPITTFRLIGGDSADGDWSWPYIDESLPVWKFNGASDALGLFNHHRGHAFPPITQTRAYDWLNRFPREAGRRLG